MASLPSDRTKLALAQNNQVPNMVIASAKNINSIVEAYDTIDLLNQKVDTNYGAGAIGTNQLATDSVTLVKMANASVGTTELVDASVTAAKIAVGAITSAQIADLSIATGDLADALITTAKLADLNVTTGKLADASVTLAKMAAASVGTSQLVDGSVTDGKIASGVITADKFVAGALNNDTQNGLNIVALQTEAAYMNGKHFGAVGDGVTDDTAALQTAIDYCFANKKDLFLDGVFLVSPTLQTDGTYVCLKVDDKNTVASGSDVLGITIYGNNRTQIKSNSPTITHTLMRWKAGNSRLRDIRFSGTRSRTNALEMSRMSHGTDGNFNHADESVKSYFSNLRFDALKNGITMEESCYYNNFYNLNMINTDQMIWMRLPDIFLNGITTAASGVNRNNFFGVSGISCTNGIRIDCGDTNKFYSCSFESLTGNAVEIYDSNAAHPGVENTNYNTFYGVTNESNIGMNLIYSGLAGMNSFIDFESSYTKVTLTNRPAYYSQSGSANAHQIDKYITQTDGQDVLKYKQLRTYIESQTYVKGVSDIIGLDGSGVYKGYNWRTFSFLSTDCVNVSAVSFNNAGSGLPLYKSLGGIVYYINKFRFTPTNNTLDIQIPLPILTEYAPIYAFGNDPSMGMPIQVSIDTGTTQVTTYAMLTGAGSGKIKIKAPSGGWAVGNTNLALINIFYPRSDIIVNQDTN